MFEQSIVAIAPAILKTEQQQIQEIVELHRNSTVKYANATEDLIKSSIAIGEKLTGLKDAITGAGKSFKDWAEKNLPFDRSHAYNYMYMYEFRDVVLKACAIAKEHGEELSLRTALGLIKVARGTKEGKGTEEDIDPFIDSFLAKEVEFEVGRGSKVSMSLQILRDKYQLFRSKAKGLSQEYETKANLMRLVAQRVVAGQEIEDEILKPAMEALEIK